MVTIHVLVVLPPGDVILTRAGTTLREGGGEQWVRGNGCTGQSQLGMTHFALVEVCLCVSCGGRVEGMACWSGWGTVDPLPAPSVVAWARVFLPWGRNIVHHLLTPLPILIRTPSTWPSPAPSPPLSGATGSVCCSISSQWAWLGTGRWCHSSHACDGGGLEGRRGGEWKVGSYTQAGYL